MDLITKVVGDTWPILLVIAAIVGIGITGIILWNRHRRKAQSVTVKDSTVVTPQSSTSRMMHAIVFDNGVARELNIPIDLIQSNSRPLFPREMANKKIILLELIPESESTPLIEAAVSIPETESKGNGKKDGLDFLEVLGQKPAIHNSGGATPVLDSDSRPKLKRGKRKNAKRVKAKV